MNRKKRIFAILAYSNCQRKTLIFIPYLLTRAYLLPNLLVSFTFQGRNPERNRKSMHSMLE